MNNPHAHAADMASDSAPDMRLVRGRLAPSPTGYLHLGNAWSFLLCWLAIRSRGGTVVLRMEDIDPDRSRPEFAEGILRDLAWLGLDWDEGPDVGGPYTPYVQSRRYDRYAAVLERLQQAGHLYPCFCTRRELRALASAPHAGEQGAAYPGTCRQLSDAEREARRGEGRGASLRLHWSGEFLSFHDLLHGDIRLSWEDCGGDFAVQRSDGVVAYQLAVAVDDMDQDISLVVRGDDILHCTPRQVLLHTLLDRPVPEYAHVPLVHDHEGERLAKRHRHFELCVLRDSGVRPEAVVGYLAFRAGLLPEPAPVHPAQLVSGFRLTDIPCSRVVLPEDIVPLLAGL